MSGGRTGGLCTVMSIAPWVIVIWDLVNRQTDKHTPESITYPQLCKWTVKIIVQYYL